MYVGSAAVKTALDFGLEKIYRPLWVFFWELRPTFAALSQTAGMVAAGEKRKPPDFSPGYLKQKVSKKHKQ